MKKSYYVFGPMNKRDALARWLAVVGTVLVWFPIVAPILFSVGLMIRAGIFRFDYLMPAELFLVALVGIGLLVWASIRTHSYQRMIGWSVGLAVVLLVGSQVLAVVLGLASGENEPSGWRWAIVLAAYVGYLLAHAAIGVGGVLLMREE
jgi:hypothetical protein